mmetsp:Transcript_2024/g.4925  ORF Transcript_2024/g.4925 Transcript_2024/m.4925 type:complete len:300 (-) Transcript_2024:1966-2865(-)
MKDFVLFSAGIQDYSRVATKTQPIHLTRIRGEKMKLFHYTNKEGYEAIRREGFIRPSNSAMYGRGVYLTDLDPHQNEKGVIARKLYWTGGPSRVRTGHLDYRIEVEIPQSEITLKRQHVYCYETKNGGPLKLSRYEKSRFFQTAALSVVAVAGLVASAGGIGAQSTVLVVAAGMIVAIMLADAQLVAMADAQRRRALKLENRLQRLLREELFNHEELCTIQTNANCTSVAMYCKRCREEKRKSVQITRAYDGGRFYATPIYKTVVKAAIMLHYIEFHFWDDYWINCIIASALVTLFFLF